MNIEKLAITFVCPKHGITKCTEMSDTVKLKCGCVWTRGNYFVAMTKDKRK